MITLFETQAWPVERALLHIGTGSEVLDDKRLEVARDWMADPLRSPAPTNSDVQHARLKRLSAMIKTSFGDKADGLTMSPVVWAWFAFTKARGSCSKGFRTLLESWTTQHLLNGRIPVVQLRPEGRAKWPPVRLEVSAKGFESGLPFASLLLQPFQRDAALGEWRLIIHPVTTMQRRQNKKAPARSPDSPACQAMIERGLTEVARRTKKVRRLRVGGADGKSYEAPELSRHEVLSEIAKTTVGSEVEAYGVSTRLRAVSNLVACRRGRPPGTPGGSNASD